MDIARHVPSPGRVALVARQRTPGHRSIMAFQIVRTSS